MPAKYSVFSIRLKESPEWFPIGVVLWSSELDLVLMRLISSAERPREIPKEDYPLIEQFKEDLEVCQSAEYLAIRKLELKPSTEEFWKFVRDSLSKRFRLSQEFHVKSDNLEQLWLLVTGTGSNGSSVVIMPLSTIWPKLKGLLQKIWESGKKVLRNP